MSILRRKQLRDFVHHLFAIESRQRFSSKRKVLVGIKRVFFDFQ